MIHNIAYLCPTKSGSKSLKRCRNDRIRTKNLVLTQFFNFFSSFFLLLLILFQNRVPCIKLGLLMYTILYIFLTISGSKLPKRCRNDRIRTKNLLLTQFFDIIMSFFAISPRFISNSCSSLKTGFQDSYNAVPVMCKRRVKMRKMINSVQIRNKFILSLTFNTKYTQKLSTKFQLSNQKWSKCNFLLSVVNRALTATAPLRSGRRLFRNCTATALRGSLRCGAPLC